MRPTLTEAHWKKAGSLVQGWGAVQAKFLMRYRRRHPGVKIHIVEDGGVRLNSRLARGSP